ncbi:SAVED domain-containing protein [Nocardioides sp. URHA0032]|uniref:SAVED domain-containing protein n=1 Tax=Nocardioides sp. URHA0032 TaxID=1380388 RepID=UPI0006849BBE|nr:SAVED domain-containing protein [Nocardioides sp. URHA0032]
MAKRARSTGVKREKIPDSVRNALWARCAGRCTLCNRRLLGDARTYFHSALAAQLAHNVGATDGEGSPRVSEDIVDREAEENLLLVCHDCHKIIDHKAHIHLYPREKLQALKQQHEDRIEKVTAQGGLTRTAVLRLGSNIHNALAIASRRDVGEVLIEDDCLALVESQWSGDFTCRVHGDVGDSAYWLGAEDTINKTIRTIHQAIDQGDVEHLSVFAIAPIPVLVYAGSKLDDKVPVRIYQRSRDAAQGWRWNPTAPIVDFEHTVTAGSGDDVVLTCGISAPIDRAKLPSNLHGATIVDLHPRDVAPSPTLIANEASLKNFADAWRTMLAIAEQTAPQAKRWHLVAATPVSLSVAMGQSFMRVAQPPVTVYERGETEYFTALEVNA